MVGKSTGVQWTIGTFPQGEDSLFPTYAFDIDNAQLIGPSDFTLTLNVAADEQGNSFLIESWQSGPVFEDGYIVELIIPSIAPCETTFEVTYWEFFSSQLSMNNYLPLEVMPVPVPGAVILGMLGLSAVGIRLRKFA